eukprot:g48340.t1
MVARTTTTRGKATTTHCIHHVRVPHNELLVAVSTYTKRGYGDASQEEGRRSTSNSSKEPVAQVPSPAPAVEEKDVGEARQKMDEVSLNVGGLGSGYIPPKK